MKLTLVLLLLSFSLVAQNKLSVLGGVSYSPIISVNGINKHSLIPSFNMLIGDEKTMLLVCVGNISKVGVLARKGFFRAGINVGVDLFQYNSIKPIAELEAGVLMPISKDKGTTLNISMCIGVTVEESNAMYTPLSIGIYKKII